MAKDDFRRRFELGGGAALDVGCYAVSCLRFVAGEEPEVLSVAHKCMSPQIDRWMRATLRFPSGVEGAVEFGFRGLYMPRDDVVATCEKGSDQVGRRRPRAGEKWQGDSRIASRQNRPTDFSLRRLRKVSGARGRMRFHPMMQS